MMVVYVDDVFGRRWSRLQTMTTTISTEILKHGAYKDQGQAPRIRFDKLQFTACCVQLPVRGRSPR